MNKLQSIQNELLVRFIEVCRKHKLKYYVVGGTLLGTVRHGGFIPWDDDIDVAMPRDDYEILTKELVNSFEEPYFLQTFETDKDYPFNFAKLRNSNTTFLETSVKNIKMNHGVYIDIFPLDGIANNYFLRKLQIFQTRVYEKRIAEVFYFKEMSQSIVSKGISFILKLIYPDVKKVIRKKELLHKKYPYDQSKDVINFCGAYGVREIMKREYWGSGKPAMFETTSVIMPIEYRAYLEGIYGDYMKVPPIEQQVSHHATEKIDLDISYRLVQEETLVRDCSEAK